MPRDIIEESTLELLLHYKPNSVEQLAEWILMAASNLKDPDGKRILNPLKPDMAWQIALMMKVARLKVPR